MGTGAATASATTWNPNPTGGYVTSPNGFTLYWGETAVSCTVFGTGWEGFFFGEGVSFSRIPEGNCNGGKQNFGWNLEAHASVEGSTYHLNPFLNSTHQNKSPWGTYEQCYSCGSPAPKGTWTNGSGSTPSTWTFVKQPIGKLSEKVIAISGTFTVKTLSGGLLTLS